MFHWFLQQLFGKGQLDSRGTTWFSDFIERVGEWRALTFGPVKGNALERRIVAEMDELKHELLRVEQVIHSDHFITYDDTRDKQRILKEMCDVIVTICAWVWENKMDLIQGLDEVQSLNERRRWKRHNDGTGQHIKERSHE